MLPVLSVHNSILWNSKNINRKQKYWKTVCEGAELFRVHRSFTVLLISANTVEVKLFSSSADKKVEVERAPVLSPPTAISAVAYYGEYWLGCVVGAHETEYAFTVKFLHP